jgi:ankyrin repeat protein
MGRQADTALFREARNVSGSVDRLRELIAAGADVNRRHKYGHTPLHEAAFHVRIDMVTVLLAAGADPNICGNDGGGPLFWAARGEHLELVELLLTNGADPNALRDGEASPLWVAISNRHATIVQRLVEAGAAVDHRFWGQTMLECAASQPEIAAILRRARRTSYTGPSTSPDANLP